MRSTVSKAPYQRVNKRTLLVVAENGDISRAPVQLWLDPRGEPRFVYLLPDYVSGNLGIAKEASAETADRAHLAYELAIRKYCDWARSRVAEPVIIVDGMYLGRHENGHHIEEDCFFFQDSSGQWDVKNAAGLKYKLAFKVNGQLHWRDRDRSVDDDTAPNAYKVGMMMGNYDAESKNVLPYTPELHARLDLICGALNRAAQALEAILSAKDVGAKLLSIKTPLLESK